MVISQRGLRKILFFWLIPFFAGGGIGTGYTITKRILSRIESINKTKEISKRNLKGIEFQKPINQSSASLAGLSKILLDHSIENKNVNKEI